MGRRGAGKAKDRPPLSGLEVYYEVSIPSFLYFISLRESVL